MAENTQPRIKGIFSRQTDTVVGTGATRRKQASVTFWFAKENQDGAITLQPLDDSFVPVGRTETMDRSQFLKDYYLEPELWYRHVSQRLAHGDNYRESEQYIEAKIEYNRVLSIDEGNIRANFGLGLVYLAQNQLEKADYVFEKLVNMQETFLPQHKHLFNDFGIALRKKTMFDQAMRYYARALELSPKDENLHLNMARALWEQGKPDHAYTHLKNVLDLNPAHLEALAFVHFLLKNNVRPETDEKLRFFRTALAAGKTENA